MRALIFGILIFLAGLGLGWYSVYQRNVDPEPAVRPFIRPPARPDSPATSAVTAPVLPVAANEMARLLRRNDFEAALEHYESLQYQADETMMEEARGQIFSYAGQLIAEHRFSEAEQLLQQFLVVAYRDVEARMLLAEVYQGQGDLLTAIDQLYEARGYAFRPDRLQRISGRIRATVSELAQSLKRNGDDHALLALYQHLIQLEPDHAFWFMGLANTQLALDDKEAARRSLLLIAQDPDIGAQAQAMLSELSLASTDLQGAGSWDTAAEMINIPLQRIGTHFIVDATPAAGRSVQLLVDTGASLTILTPQVLQQGDIHYEDTGRTAVFHTANGSVEAPVYRLDSLAVGDWYVTRLEVGVLELGESAGVDGLLGMNFLNRFQFFIDQNEALLHLFAK
jgi:clan AA aspartic protease (TIGR02281 family)